MQSDHFKAAIDLLPDYVTAPPEIVNLEIPDAQGSSEMGEVSPR